MLVMPETFGPYHICYTLYDIPITDMSIFTFYWLIYTADSAREKKVLVRDKW